MCEPSESIWIWKRRTVYRSAIKHCSLATWSIFAAATFTWSFLYSHSLWSIQFLWCKWSVFMSFLSRLSETLCPTLLITVSILRVWWLIFLLHLSTAPPTGQILQSLCPCLSPCPLAALSLSGDINRQITSNPLSILPISTLFSRMLL